MIPIAGSAYTYSYATLGEIFAWIIGWDLILEYVVSNMAVAWDSAATPRRNWLRSESILPDKWASPGFAGGTLDWAYLILPEFSDRVSF